MDLLERTWESVGLFFGGLMHGFERGVTALFGSSNARVVRRMQGRVAAINELEPRYQAMSDSELREQTVKFRERLRAGETLEDILVEAFAVCREGGRRFLSMRHYDVQLVGGMVLHSGAIGEMITGEGKTLVATLPAYLNALEGKGVHVVTVNDYLARRDMEWMGPLYMGLGLTVGAIQSDMDPDERQEAYACDITYGTNNEFGFDYLRDNMRSAARGDTRFHPSQRQAQGPLNFAIIDEVDNILIDEARTPLIISGPAHDNPKKYQDADRIARQLQKEKHFTVNEKDHNVSLTDEGVRAAEKLAGVESFYTAGNMEWPHLIDNALKAHHLYQRDVRYVVEDGKVVIVDEFTGRKMDGRQWSDGLHQAVEAKEGVKIKEETQTLATITLQNFFKLYNKICGMTGTAMTESSEFWKIYKLEVVAIPSNRKMQRIEYPDAIYKTEKDKFIAIADEVERAHKYDTVYLKDETFVVGELISESEEQVQIRDKDNNQVETFPRDKVTVIEPHGRPVLIGTVSIEKSERISEMLDRRGVKHAVLNAKHHKREAEIISQAGRMNAVTIATNMAGRGTDIILGGNPETMAWAMLQDKYKTRLDVPPAEWDELVRQIEQREQMKPEGAKVKAIGGLYVLGTERHEARRIDLQLRGRCGRQGDPGSSRFFLSLEDDLMRIFAGQWVKSILEFLGMKDGERIEHPMVSRRISAVQKKMEERNFEVRKNLLEYDEVMDMQRRRVYGFRQNILDGENCRELILEMVRKQIDSQVDKLLRPDYGAERFAAFASERLSAQFEARNFRKMNFEEAEAYARDEAERAAESHVHDGMDENLPSDVEDEDEWNWAAMAKMAETRWKIKTSEAELKRIGRDGVAEFLLEKAGQAIRGMDLSDGQEYLDEQFAASEVVAWAHKQFGLELQRDQIHGKDAVAVKKQVFEKAREAYDIRETAYPIMAAVYRYGGGARGMNDKEGLANWARERLQATFDPEQFRGLERKEVFQLLAPFSHKSQERAEEALAEVHRKLESLFGPEAKNTKDNRTAKEVQGGNGALTSVARWASETLGRNLDADAIGAMTRTELDKTLRGAVENRYRPEIRLMERQLLLQIVDELWKDHLLVMDRLRSAIGLVGYAQVDPKVEYKREGMRLFEQMWGVVGQRATELVFKIEHLSEDFVSSVWVETAATHAEAGSLVETATRTAEETSSSGGGDVEAKREPIRNRGQRVGRNDPCPCGSGKKFKTCCMRREVV